MKTTAGEMTRNRLAACAASLCALVTSLAFAVTPAAAEAGDAAPIRPLSERGWSVPEIAGPESPEEYPVQWGSLDPEMKMRQVSDQEIVAEYFKYGVASYSINALPAHDAIGTAVPSCTP